MKLSRTIAYGIYAAIQFAGAPSGDLVPASQLARVGSLPERFLVQILHSLVTNRILTPACGVSGGYRLARPAAQITLRDIVASFDNSLDVGPSNLSFLSAAARSRLKNDPRRRDESGAGRIRGSEIRRTLGLRTDCGWVQHQQQSVADEPEFTINRLQ